MLGKFGASDSQREALRVVSGGGVPVKPARPAGVVSQSGPVHTQSGSVEPSGAVQLGTAKNLSASGQLKTNERQREMCCLLDDGRLLIQQHKENDPFVQSYIAILVRSGVKFRIVPAQVREIASAYSSEHVETIGTRATDRSHTETEAQKLFETAVQLRASDIHIRQGRHDTEVLLRVHGELEPQPSLTADAGKRLIRTIYQSMADISESTFDDNARLDARIGRKETLPRLLSGIRIATTPSDVGSLMVLRLLYDDAGASLDPRDLGFSEEQHQMLRHIMSKPIGMNLITGPTGSGKSTTLQRMLRRFIQETGGRKHVITVEDPPEYPIPGAVQTPCGNATSQEERAEMFIEAIRSAMRLDPDTIMIGEIRDEASANLALYAATTGHQVWTTLHANGALPSAARLIDLGLDKNMVLDHEVLTGLISQRLARRLCDNCKIPLVDVMDSLTPAFLERLQRVLGPAYRDTFVTNPKGCDCPGCRKGVVGRTALAEIVIPDPMLCDYLRKDNRIAARKHWLTEQGGMTFVAHAIEKIKAGLIDPLVTEALVGRLTTDVMLSDSIISKDEWLHA